MGQPDVVVRSLTDLSELADAQRVFDAVWPTGNGATQVQTNLMRAIVHAGGYASAAYQAGEPVGAAFGFLGQHDHDGEFAVHLHSHMAAVLQSHRDRHIGSELKYHQRLWALDRGIGTIVWTFDPLVRRNAVVNLTKLGVDVDGFEPNFYGNMDDAINANDPTDRLFAWWHLDSARALAAARGELATLDRIELAASGRDVIEVDLPADIVSLRAEDPAAAAHWRLQVRDGLQTAFLAGYRVIGVSAVGNFVLERTS